MPEAREAVAGVAVHLVEAAAVVEAGQGQAVIDVDLTPRPRDACVIVQSQIFF